MGKIKKQQKTKLDALNITLERRIKLKYPWSLKEWDVYSGKYWLGRIVKRRAGPSTDIRLKKPCNIFQLSININTSEMGGVSYSKGLYPYTLLDAKRQFRIYYNRLIQTLITHK